MATFLGLLPVIMQLLAWVLGWYGAKQATLQKFEELVKAAHDEGLITVAIKDGFISQKAKLEERLKAEKPQ